ncbi:uridine 5'-monophosphate synthase [Venturia canescens]|uniref:uridine 5'-monophosphate synthase n=1 Tax=Venturia canescens TaxID=32260 RepID=UPI001C9BBCFB|nr:uridine 5'-monophosphate synthase [Venturia canescens]
MGAELKELATELYEIGAFKFGEFVTKVGLKTPVYIDLRVIISHPKVLRKLSSVLWELSGKPEEIQQICGVPYTALPIATLISAESNIPMVIRRKEVKSYGTKKLIEGNFKSGDNCVIIEDIVTSGSSILETVSDLRKEGLTVTEAYVVVDREQGGRKNIESNEIQMKSLYTLTELMGYLLEAKKVTEETVENVTKYLKECRAPKKTITKEDGTKRLKLSFSSRAKLSKRPMATKLFELMDTKETMICLAADLTKTDEILELADLTGPHIAVLKIHVDIIEDFNDNFINNLKQLSTKHNFLLMEDRKFGDIGNTVSLQYSRGIYKISQWADLITAHTISGYGILNAFETALRGNSENRGIFLITEMSSKGALTTESYAKESVNVGTQSDLVIGHVCQSNVFSDPSLIQLTPGVRIAKASDDLGQQYNSPESVVNSGADLAVVGRGITEANDKLKTLLQYKTQLWSAYKQRLSS